MMYVTEIPYTTGPAVGNLTLQLPRPCDQIKEEPRHEKGVRK